MGHDQGCSGKGSLPDCRADEREDPRESRLLPVKSWQNVCMGLRPLLQSSPLAEPAAGGNL
jgi:hypothetical protein